MINIDGSNLKNGDVLVFVDPGSELGEIINTKSPQIDWPAKLKSHQYKAKDFVLVNAFYLRNGDKKLFVVSSKDENSRNKVKAQINSTKEIIKKFDLHKGWFGAYTLLNSVTCTKGHPLEVIGTGMNEGASWFVFEGYMDFLSKDDFTEWLKEVKLPIVTDVGATQVYGCKDYDGFQIQQMYTTESWVDFAREKEGYVFRQVWDTAADPYKYDGYFAIEGNKEQIDNEDVPFVLKTGMLDKNALSSMVLFLEKGKQLTRESMWDAILDRREVGVLAQGKMMGPALYRNALQMLLLDRVFLEDYFGDRIDLQAVVDAYDLQVTITNTTDETVSGTMELSLPKEVKVKEKSSVTVNLTPRSAKTLHFKLQPGKNAMDNTNPLAVHYKWNGKKKERKLTENKDDIRYLFSVNKKNKLKRRKQNE